MRDKFSIFQVPFSIDFPFNNLQIKKLCNRWQMADGRWQILERGFTLIELLVAFSLVSLFAASGVIGVSKYNERQILRNAALELRGTLIDAKARAQSQIKPKSLCPLPTEKLDGYKVVICDLEPLSCSLGKNYEIHVVCNGIDRPISGSGKKLPNNIIFSTTSGPSSVFFKVLNAEVVGTGNIVLKGYEDLTTINVDANGNITIL